MFSFLRKIDKSGGQVGLMFGDAGLAIAEIHGHATGQKPRLAHCAYLEEGDGEALGRAAHGLTHRKLPTVTVLPSSSYQMLLVEAPEVPPEELRAAVRWRIKELIDYHIDDAVIDVFQMPGQGRGGSNRMMYAIAAKADSVKEQVSVVEASGLKLDVIDVIELCLRNVAAALEDNGRGVALLYLADKGGILLLVRQGVLYLTRRIDTGVETLRSENGLRSELLAGLALEARRSLDYFESHYEQNPMSVLYTSGLDPADQDVLTAELGISVRNAGFTSFLDTEIELSDEMERQCLPAVGAALRKDQVTL